MKRQFAVLLLGLAVVLVAAGQLARADAGPSPADIQDSRPVWRTSDAIAFQRTAPTLQHVLSMLPSGRDLSVASTSGVLRGSVPGTMSMLLQSGDTTLVTTGGRFAGPPGVLPGTDASAAPDGLRVAYLRAGTLFAARLDGTGGERALATGIAPPSWDVTGPVWSPDGTQIVVASGSSLVLVQADGSGSHLLFSGANQSVNPSWSPDGSLVAFERNAAAHWQIWLVNRDGTGAREEIGGSANDRYPRFSPRSNTLAFISDRQHARGGATQYQFALYTQALGGVARKLVDDVHPYSPPAWSPTAAQIAVSAGQECRRWGIYVTRADVGSRAVRRSNICRIDGTPVADRIRGSLYFDIINGNGGNDVIHGRTGNDKLSGENGNDTIYGDAGNDFILAGPGNDRVYGGPGNDTIIGGNGRDRIDCGPGDDRVEGVGPLDTVAKNCEHVSR